MKKCFKLLLCLLLLCSCTKQKKSQETSDELAAKDYLALLENYQTKAINKNKLQDDEAFNEYLNELFIETMESDYLNTHYTIVDLSAFDIEKPDLTLGELEYSSEPDNEELVADYQKLLSFTYDNLSTKQQYDYQCLEYSFLESLAYSYYEHYDLLFDGGTDLLANIVTNFEEFVFYKQEDIDDYLVLLKDIDRYLADALEYTSMQAEDGLYLSDCSIDYTVDYAKDFTANIEDNSLITSFEKKLATITYLDEETKNNYLSENKTIVQDEVIPAFNKVTNELTAYYGKTEVFDNALANIDKDYAKLCYMINYSSNKDPKLVFEEANDLYDEMMGCFNSAMDNEQAINQYLTIYYNQLAPFNEDNETILTYLITNYQKFFPAVEKIEYELSLLDESSASDSVIAYYLDPPLDQPSQNVIRINPNADTTGISAYTTLAHEGVPGHMYQHIYSEQQNLSLARKTQSFIGYVEGYACYSQNMALRNSELSEEAVDLLVLDDFGPYIFESIVDIGVNYLNWDLKDVKNFMDESGYDSDYALSIVEDVIDRPATLVRYGIGYVNFMELYNLASSELGNKFSDIEFNQAILENGELPFPILEMIVEDYISEHE